MGDPTPDDWTRVLPPVSSPESFSQRALLNPELSLAQNFVLRASIFARVG